MAMVNSRRIMVGILGEGNASTPLVEWTARTESKRRLCEGGTPSVFYHQSTLHDASESSAMVFLSRIYTKSGDTGETGLGDGIRVPKDHPRVIAYGEVDEL